MQICSKMGLFVIKKISRPRVSNGRTNECTSREHFMPPVSLDWSLNVLRSCVVTARRVCIARN